MRTKLKFFLPDVKELVLKTLSAKNHAVTFEQRFNSYFARAGVKRAVGRYLEDHEIDEGKIKPALWLIQEDGVFLGSSAVGGLKKDNGKKMVVYADGFEPKGRCEKLSRAICEEDFCQPVVLINDLQKMIFEDSGSHFVINWWRKGFSLNIEKLY